MVNVNYFPLTIYNQSLFLTPDSRIKDVEAERALYGLAANENIEAHTRWLHFDKLRSGKRIAPANYSGLFN